VFFVFYCSMTLLKLLADPLIILRSLNRWRRLGMSLLVAIAVTLGLVGPLAGPMEGAIAAPLPTAGSTVAYLPPGNAITDGRALLRYALPIDNDEVRKLQSDLEEIAESLRGKRWSPIKRNVTKAERVVSRGRDKILAAVSDDRRAAAAELLDQIEQGLPAVREAAEQRDKEAVWINRRALLAQVGQLEELMLGDFPYEVPEEYADLPQLKGRATVVFETTRGPVTSIIDGYSAPVTAGNFVDLVNRGFYDGLGFIRAEDFYVLQTGDPPGPEEGFIDPATGEYRAIPLEILVKGDEKPTYGNTLEALGRYLEDPVLPFSAYGALAMARPGNDPNGGSSQFFFFLFEPELTPAGRNLLDGRYAIFGYAVDGDEVLRKMNQDDQIISAKVVEGLENLVQPSQS
jgi:peptidylprolyl isomerase